MLYMCSALVHSVSKLYTQNPKCKPWGYIRGSILGKIIGLVYRGAYFRRVADIRRGLCFGFYGISAIINWKSFHLRLILLLTSKEIAYFFSCFQFRRPAMAGKFGSSNFEQ